MRDANPINKPFRGTVPASIWLRGDRRAATTEARLLAARHSSSSLIHVCTRSTTMKCHELAASIEALQPEADLRDVARLCLLLANTMDEHDALADENTLCRAWRETGLRLQAATDQHAAMTDELESLAEGDLSDLSREKILVLIRAIRVQSQVLEMYVGTERMSG